MAKWFNTTGPCIPEKHYMVDLNEKLKKIKRMIDREFYFTINRGRQYGKTTIIASLERYLAADYTVISLSFQGFDEDNFLTSESFCQEFLRAASEELKSSGKATGWMDESVKNFSDLSRHLTKQCRDKKIVLMIDEVDQASNHRVFLNFLGILRDKFIERSKGKDFTFHSVILVGVYDVKNIKLKMIQSGAHTLQEGEKQVNSPWNIAEQFKVDISFSESEIVGMLEDYESEHQTGMNVGEVASKIYFYTNGYPVLVSSLCRYLDEELEEQWDVEGVEEAVRRLVRETENELFKSLSQKLENNEEIRDLLYDVLISGVRRSFSVYNTSLGLAYRYSYIKEIKGRVKISNRIFEIVMLDYFISKDESRKDAVANGGYIAEITRDGKFNMPLCLERFLVHWQEIYSEKDGKFLERHCRMIFLSYLKPILNGVGFSFIETAFTDDRRMDLIVIYNNERFVLELKIWKGLLYNEEGCEQLLGYLETLSEEKGYLLTFDFRKKPVPFEPEWTTHGQRQIFEARVFSSPFR